MKKFILIALMFFGSLALYAQAASLEEVCKSLASRPNTTGEFVQIKTLNANRRQLKSFGTFIISTEEILWKTEKPFPSSLILTKDAMVQIAANGKRSVMDGKDNQIFANISETLSSVFSGNVDQLKKNFECDFEGEDTLWKITLKPKDSTIASVMNFLELGGSLEGGLAALDYLEMNEASSNKIRYEFANQKYPKELSADEKTNFIFE